ncbi:hypothetical protein [Romboutsia timonensis]|uniref:hypothetical protein n=1 Tax=Romboutsia timonensis TaxID=1776391 RepID=UPI002A74C42C|nr:hypothetical protein [Romboutsia timonensis]MCI6668288.1 hypothetical protein [Romboutsia timonensis]MDY2881286.1 hypothetical protein [Romboutsia timonensis]MDY3001483.1 hypothetical protein [Romboutsia timonensis]MDY3958783.1 hypothetical protein [Romboutsia timonensis]
MKENKKQREVNMPFVVLTTLATTIYSLFHNEKYKFIAVMLFPLAYILIRILNEYSWITYKTDSLKFRKFVFESIIYTIFCYVVYISYNLLF